MITIDQAAEILLADFEDPMIHYFARLVFTMPALADEMYQKHQPGWRPGGIGRELQNTQLYQLTEYIKQVTNEQDIFTLEMMNIER